MEEAKLLIEWVQGIGLTGMLILLAFPKTRKWLGFDGAGNLEDSIAAALKKAFADANESPILVKSQIKRICDDIEQIRESNQVMRADIAFIKGALDAERHGNKA
jgi:hypothetical protein